METETMTDHLNTFADSIVSAWRSFKNTTRVETARTTQHPLADKHIDAVDVYAPDADPDTLGRIGARHGLVRVIGDHTSIASDATRFVRGTDIKPVTSEDNPELNVRTDDWSLEKSGPHEYIIVLNDEYEVRINDLGRIGVRYYAKFDGDCVLEIIGTKTAGFGYVIRNVYTGYQQQQTETESVVN